MLTIYSAIGGAILLIGGFIATWFHGKSVGEAKEKVNTDNAKQETANVVTQSQIADAEVKQAASDQKEATEAANKRIDDTIKQMDQGDASKELFAKYGDKDENNS